MDEQGSPANEEEYLAAFRQANDQSAGHIVSWAMDALDALKENNYERAYAIYQAISTAASNMATNSYVLFLNEYKESLDN